jgi:hypothetical protein
MYRNSDWEGPADIGSAVHKASCEVMPLFGIVVTDGGNSGSPEDFKKTVDSIIATSWPVEKLRVMLSTTNHQQMPAMAHLVNSTQKAAQLDVRAVFHNLIDPNIKDYDTFSKLAQATYFISIEAGVEVPLDLFSQVNDSLNTKLERMIMFESKSLTIIRASVMKSIYRKFNDYTLATDEVRTLSQQAGMHKVLHEKE